MNTKWTVLALAPLVVLGSCRDATQRDELSDLQSSYTRTNGVYQGPIDPGERDERGLRSDRLEALGGPGEPGNVGRYEHFEGSTRSPVDRKYHEQVQNALIELLGPDGASRIQAEVISGRVTLKGKVESEEERRLVVHTVDSLMGTGSVNDELRVEEEEAENSPPPR